MTSSKYYDFANTEIFMKHLYCSSWRIKFSMEYLYRCVENLADHTAMKSDQMPPKI